MNRLGLLTILTTTAILLSCSEKKADINGHWHSLTPEIGSFKTLDIGDSITTTDKYEIEVSRNNWLLRKDVKTGESILPFQDDSWTGNFQLDGDTLKITDQGHSYKYMRSKIEKCEIADRYNHSAINISLQESPTAEDYDQLSFCANMFIGKPIKVERQDLAKEYPDSVFIQVSDVFIALKDIPQYCNRTMDAFPSGEKIEVVLHADTSVSELSIKKILEKVPPTMATYRAVKTSGQLSVSKIIRD